MRSGPSGLAIVAAFMCLAQPAAAQSVNAVALAEASLVRGLEAQFQAALIRERRLADDREQRLISEAEARLSRARAAADQASGDTAAIEAELEAARRDYADLLDGVGQRDAAARAEIEAYRNEAAEMVARASPERLAALQRFADGDRVGAWPVIEELTLASVRARLIAADAAAAEDLAEIDRLRGEMDDSHP